MDISLYLGPVFSVIAGILILVFPRILSHVIAIYLIMIGLVSLIVDRM